jgi:hypothetical protein
MRMIARLLMASLKGIALLTIPVSRTAADGAILRSRAMLSGAAGSGISGSASRIRTPAILFIWATCPTSKPMTRALLYLST